jgi:hypothetical protein
MLLRKYWFGCRPEEKSSIESSTLVLVFRGNTSLISNRLETVPIFYTHSQRSYAILVARASSTENFATIKLNDTGFSFISYHSKSFECVDMAEIFVAEAENYGSWTQKLNVKNATLKWLFLGPTHVIRDTIMQISWAISAAAT